MNQYAAFESQVREFTAEICQPWCANCKKVCCKSEFCQESLDSPFLSLLRNRFLPVHTLDILATRDDVLAKLRLGIAILTSNDNNQFVSLEDVFRFDTTAYDVNLEYKAIVAIPRMAEEAKLFAERQNIRVFEIDDINELMFHIEEQSNILPSASMNEKDNDAIDGCTASDMSEFPLIYIKIKLSNF